MLMLVSVWQTLFAITPLNWTEWKAVLLFSFPVVLIDEVLKFCTVRSFPLLPFPPFPPFHFLPEHR